MAYPVTYHCQNTPTFCGNACVQMLIFSLDGKTLIMQQDWQLSLEDEGWGTFPTNLPGCLNGLKNKPKPLTFRLLICDTEAVISQWIAYTIRKGRPAPMVLVWGNDHWILVTDCTLKTDPIDDTPSTKYDIDNFVIADPSVDNSGTDEPCATCRNSKLNISTIHDTGFTCGDGVIKIRCSGRKCKLDVGRKKRYASYGYWKGYWLYRFPPTTGPSRDWTWKYLAVVAVDSSDPVDGTGFTSWSAPGIICP